MLSLLYITLIMLSSLHVTLNMLSLLHKLNSHFSFILLLLLCLFLSYKYECGPTAAHVGGIGWHVEEDCQQLCCLDFHAFASQPLLRVINEGCSPFLSCVKSEGFLCSLFYLLLYSFSCIYICTILYSLCEIYNSVLELINSKFFFQHVTKDKNCFLNRSLIYQQR